MARTEGTVLAWPATLMRDDEGRVQVRFPDFPEALTDAADEWEALAEAADCLAEAVAARIADGEDIPAPGPIAPRHACCASFALLAYKAALFSAMRRDGISKSELARRLCVDEKDVRRLIDPRYRGSKVERLHAALAACGVGAQLTLVDASDERLFGSRRSGPANRRSRPPRRRRAGQGSNSAA